MGLKLNNTKYYLEVILKSDISELSIFIPRIIKIRAILKNRDFQLKRDKRLISYLKPGSGRKKLDIISIITISFLGFNICYKKTTTRIKRDVRSALKNEGKRTGKQLVKMKKKQF